MRYGDTADIGGLPERFEPGAFGDVGAADVLLNRQHDRTEPLARTGGAGLVLMDTADSLTMRADLAGHRNREGHGGACALRSASRPIG